MMCVMPRHTYHARNEPPSFWDRVWFHPFEVSIALIWLVGATVMVGEVILQDFTPSPAMEEPADLTALLLAVTLFIGAGGVLAGLFYDQGNLMKDWLAERLGLVFGASGTLSYAVAVYWSFPGSILSWGIPILMALGCVARLIATFLEERSRRKAVAAMRGEG